MKLFWNRLAVSGVEIRDDWILGCAGIGTERTNTGARTLYAAVRSALEIDGVARRRLHVQAASLIFLDHP
jgi:hypothetical protein